MLVKACCHAHWIAKLPSPELQYPGRQQLLRPRDRDTHLKGQDRVILTFILWRKTRFENFNGNLVRLLWVVRRQGMQHRNSKPAMNARSGVVSVIQKAASDYKARCCP